MPAAKTDGAHDHHDSQSTEAGAKHETTWGDAVAASEDFGWRHQRVTSHAEHAAATAPASSGAWHTSCRSDDGTLIAMRATIDKAGRLVIPRPLRDRIGLAAGGVVEVELDGAGLRIRPVPGNELREEGGLLVIPGTGTSIDDTFVRELIDADRHRA